MDTRPLRWASSEGVFLFRVPDEDTLLPLETAILLSGGLNAISIFLEKGQLSIEDEPLTIIRINLHPPLCEDEDLECLDKGYVIHSSFKDGFSFQSIFHTNEITTDLSEFEKAFLESVVNNVHEKLDKVGRKVSDIPFLEDKVIINEVEEMLHDIDTKYKTLAASWALSAGPDCTNSRFDFSEVCYHGKIKLVDLFNDLAESAVESFNQLDFTPQQKITLFRIAKSLVSLSSILYTENEEERIRDNLLDFAHSEIILETEKTKKLFRLDVRSYTIDEEQYCDITIMGT